MRLDDAEFDAVMPALPGHDGAVPSALSTFSQVVTALAEANPEPCHLVGYSMGARVALGWAVEYPERVKSLTLIGVNPGVEDDASRAARSAWDSAMASRLLAEGIDAFMDQWAALPVFAGQAERTSEQAYAHQDKVRRRHAPEALAWAMRVLGLGTMPSYWERLAGLRMPAQLITGQFDTKFDEVAQRMCARWPTAVHHRVKGAGHNVALEMPKIIMSLCRDFMIAHHH